jgi:hypothetical protein
MCALGLPTPRAQRRVVKFQVPNTDLNSISVLCQGPSIATDFATQLRAGTADRESPIRSGLPNTAWTAEDPSSAFVNRWSGFKPLIRHQQSQALTCVGSSGNFPKSQYGKTMGSKGQVEMAVVETIPLTEILGRILVSFQDAPSNALLQLQPRGQLDSALLVALHLSRKLPSGVVEHSSP